MSQGGRKVAWEKVSREVFSQSCGVYLVTGCLVLVTWDNAWESSFYGRNEEPGLLCKRIRFTTSRLCSVSDWRALSET